MWQGGYSITRLVPTGITGGLRNTEAPDQARG